MLSLLIVAVAMLAKDGIGTLLVIAEARGRALLAGLLDAASDLANVLCTVVGAGEIVLHGWDRHAAAILTVMMATSLLGTTIWTRVGQRIAPPPATR